MAEPQPAGGPTPPAPPAQQRESKSYFTEWGPRDRILAFGIAFGIELLIFFGAMLIPISASQQQQLVNQANNLLGPASNQGSLQLFASILDNNLRVALLEMIPGIGAALFGASMFTTGQVVQALAISNNAPGPLLGLLLFFFPFAIIELSAYAIAVASGTLLIVAWRRKKLRQELGAFMLEVSVVVFALILAAAMETVGIVSPAEGLALWLPTAVGIFAVAMALRGVWRSGTSSI
jgi:uncharacterized membrane protein SpoIIM required for sporulation